MNPTVWSEVDAYFNDALIGLDPVCEATLAASRSAGLPAIDVSPMQGKQLHLLARAIGARKILEIGALGGYSAIWLARALPPGGALVSLEIDPRHAAAARTNVAAAGLGDRVEIKVGRALDLLPYLEGPFDMAFIDADKESSAAYFAESIRLVRPGGLIVVDNVVRGGAVAVPSSQAQVAGVQRMIAAIANEPRVSASAIQTVGDKGYDGYLIAVVNG